MNNPTDIKKRLATSLQEVHELNCQTAYTHAHLCVCVQGTTHTGYVTGILKLYYYPNLSFNTWETETPSGKMTCRQSYS